MGKLNLKVADLDLIELNEAFASQSVAVIKDLGLDINKVNVKSGAIVLDILLVQQGQYFLLN